jgi:hypothetical protein
VISDIAIGGSCPRVFLPDVPDALVAELRSRYRPLGFPKQIWYNYTLYGGPDVIINLSEGYQVGDGYWINMAGRTQEALERAMAALPGAGRQALRSKTTARLRANSRVALP